MMFVITFIYSFLDCLKLTLDVKESILHTLTDTSFVIDSDNIETNCSDIFEQYSLPYDQFKIQCVETKDHDGYDICIAKLILAAMKESCMESVSPVLSCVGVNVTTQLALRTFSLNSHNITKSEI